ncbi:hypothetical protein Y032_0007g3370 [Ancylostoma ceylanicum]|uniref:Uncharacterized protein n=1 Tax=Ancylostoma ceylanicum TaxID=53326 RepID=A0A016VPM1_9BILA|nr:hypothetical protein Y032_0007g3370 [Ancylostoma ceylanicum]
MLEQPQQYYDTEGRGHDLPMQRETIERIIADQLGSYAYLALTGRGIPYYSRLGDSRWEWYGTPRDTNKLAV